MGSMRRDVARRVPPATGAYGPTSAGARASCATAHGLRAHALRGKSHSQAAIAWTIAEPAAWMTRHDVRTGRPSTRMILDDCETRLE
jgi:hypothetical protein